MLLKSKVVRARVVLPSRFRKEQSRAPAGIQHYYFNDCACAKLKCYSRYGFKIGTRFANGLRKIYIEIG